LVVVGDKSSTLSAQVLSPNPSTLYHVSSLAAALRTSEEELSGCGEIAASYSRFSSDNQDVSSIEQQQKKCRDDATPNGHNLLHEYEFADEAVSGTRSDREGLQAMMAAARAGKFQVVYFASLSRLARELVISLPMLKDLVYNCGVRIVSLTDGIDSNMPNWELLATFRCWMHGEFLTVLRATVLQGQEYAFEHDFSVGDWSFGYGSEPIPGSEKGRRGRNPKPRYRVIIDKDQAEYVRLVFHWYANERRTTAWIARELNRRGAAKDHRARTKEWRPELVVKLLRRKKYIGIWPWGERTNVRNPLTGKIRQKKRPLAEAVKFVRERPDLRLVEDEVFFKAQGLLDEAKARMASCRDEKGRLRGSTKDDRNPRHLLQRLVVCGACGRTFQVSGARGVYLGCAGRLSGTCPVKTRLPRKQAERMLLQWVREQILKCPTWRELILAEARASWEARRRTNPDEIKDLEKKVDTLDAKINRLLDMIEGGEDGKQEPPPDVHARIAARRREKDAVARRLEALKREDRVEPTPPTPEWVDQKLGELEKVLGAAGPAAAIALRNLLGPVTVTVVSPEVGKRKYLRGTFTAKIAGVLREATSESTTATPGVIEFRPAKPWEAVVDRVKELFDAGVEYRAIAAQLSCPRSWVAKALSLWYGQRGLTPPDGRSLKARLPDSPETTELIDRVMALWNEDLLLHEIATLVGRCRDTVAAIVRKWHEDRGLPVPDGRNRRKSLARKSRSAETVDRTPETGTEAA
jgi:DNA invertase Pin-like site-specific DNA recombinase